MSRRGGTGEKGVSEAIRTKLEKLTRARPGETKRGHIPENLPPGPKPSIAPVDGDQVLKLSYNS